VSGRLDTEGTASGQDDGADVELAEQGKGLSPVARRGSANHEQLTDTFCQAHASKQQRGSAGRGWNGFGNPIRRP